MYEVKCSIFHCTVRSGVEAMDVSSLIRTTTDDSLSQCNNLTANHILPTTRSAPEEYPVSSCKFLLDEECAQVR